MNNYSNIDILENSFSGKPPLIMQLKDTTHFLICDISRI